MIPYFNNIDKLLLNLFFSCEWWRCKLLL